MKKKKGSSLLTVVMIFSIILTVAAVTVSLTGTDYKLRVEQGIRIKNLYSSEAGLDVTYGVINKVVEKAIQQGNAAVDTFNMQLDTEIEAEKQRIKDTDPSQERADERYVDKGGNLREDVIQAERAQIFSNQYKDYIRSNINESIEKSQYQGDNGNNIKVPLPGQPPTIQVIQSQFFSNPVDTATLQVASSFISKGAGGTENQIEKKVQVTYTIQVPPYNDKGSIQTTVVEVDKNPAWQKAISADGDLEINGDTTINGNAFVMGTFHDIHDTVYDKYLGGIVVQEKDTGKQSKVVFNGNVVTANSFSVRDISDVQIKGALYANNIYIGKESKTESDSVDWKNRNIDFTAQTVMTDNDFALNARNAVVRMENFYGLSDLNLDKVKNSTAAEKISSSILVNSDDIGKGGSETGRGSSITVTKQAYIMGTAYINTTPDPYQTGESVAVKGNYNAYSKSLGQDTFNEALKEPGVFPNKGDSTKGVTFGFFDPLTLINGFDLGDNKSTPMGYQDKSDYFYYYNKEYGDLNTKGITLPSNVVSVGSSIVGDGKVQRSSYIADAEDVLKPKREEFANNVYEMGLGSKDVSLFDKYLNGQVDEKVRKQVAWDKIKISKEQDRNIIRNSSGNFIGDRIVRNEDASRKVVVLGSGAGDSYKQSIGDIVVDLSSDGQGQGIIVARGNVEIYGNVNFRGTIVAEGKLTTIDYKDSTTKVITYDEGYVEKLIGYNYDLLNIFAETNLGVQRIQTEVNIQPTDEQHVGKIISTRNLITTKEWKILK